jgi:hypothetical protein
MSKLKLKSNGEKHTLEVQVSDEQLKELRELPPGQDTSKLMSDLIVKSIISKEQLTDQISAVKTEQNRLSRKAYDVKETSPESTEEFRRQRRFITRAGKGLRMVMDLLDGGELPGAYKRAGVALNVQLLTPSGEPVYESCGVQGADVQALFDKSWSELRRDLKLIGVSDEDIEKRRQSYQPDLERYKQALSLYASGHTKTEIASRLGLQSAAVGDWVEDRKPPWGIQWLFHRHPRFKDLPIPRTESAEFAYLLGVYASVVKSPRNELKPISRDRDAVIHFRDAVHKVFGEELEVKSSGSSKQVQLYECTLTSMKVLAYMRDITDGNTRVPWEHLLTESERRAYMQALLDFNSGVGSHKVKDRGVEKSYPIVRLTFSERPALVDDVLVLCGRLGIYPDLKTRDGVCRLIVGGRTDIGNLQDIGFNANRKTSELDDKLRDTSYTQKEYGPKEYYIAKGMWQQGKTKRAISVRVDVPVSVVKDWKNRGTKPNRVKRYEAIAAIEGRREYPDPDVIGFLYRGGASSNTACSIGKQRNIREVRESWGVLTEYGRPPRRQYTPPRRPARRTPQKTAEGSGGGS